MTKQPASDSGTPDRLDPALLKLIAVLVIGALAPLFDSTIVNVAIHTLGTDFQVSVSTIQWVITDYLLALAIAMPLSGWAVERFGGKQTWMFSLGLFLVGSVLSGSAWSASSLIVFRLFQGFSAGLMIPVMQTLLVRAAGQKVLGRAITIATLIIVIVPISGPIIGGLIVSKLSWRWVFYVNVPLCLTGLALAWRGMSVTPSQDRRPLDVAGLLLISPGLAATIYGLSQAGSRKTFVDISVLVPVAIGIALLVLFVLHALHRRSNPIIDLHLFRRRSFAISAALLFLSGLSLYGALLLIPLYFQQVRGDSALTAGLILALAGVGSLLSRPAGNYIDRLGPKPVILVGMALAALGTLAYTQASVSTSVLLLGVSLVIRGGGLGAASIAMVTAAYESLKHEEIPDASSATRILQQVGGSFGTAVVIVIFQQYMARQISSGVAEQANAFGHTFWWSVGFAAFAFILALLLPGRATGLNR